MLFGSLRLPCSLVRSLHGFELAFYTLSTGFKHSPFNTSLSNGFQHFLFNNLLSTGFELGGFNWASFVSNSTRLLATCLVKRTSASYAARSRLHLNYIVHVDACIPSPPIRGGVVAGPPDDARVPGVSPPRRGVLGQADGAGAFGALGGGDALVSHLGSTHHSRDTACSDAEHGAGFPGGGFVRHHRVVSHPLSFDVAVFRFVYLMGGINRLNVLPQHICNLYTQDQYTEKLKN